MAAQARTDEPSSDEAADLAEEVRRALDANDAPQAARSLLDRAVARGGDAEEAAAWSWVVETLGREVASSREAAERAQREAQDAKDRVRQAAQRQRPDQRPDQGQRQGQGQGQAQERDASDPDREGADDPIAGALRALAEELDQAASDREAGELSAREARSRLVAGFHRARRALSRGERRER